MEIRQHFNADIIQRITAKQVDLLYSHQPVAMFSTMLVITLLFGFLFSPEIINRLAAIYLLFWTVTTVRSFINWRYFKNRKKRAVNIDRAYKLYLAGIICNGLSWSIIILFLFPVVNLPGQILLLIVVMGFSAAAHTTMGFKKTPIIIFVSLLTIPLVYVVSESVLPNTLAITLAIIFQAIFVLRSSLMFYTTTYTMLGSTEIAMQREDELKLQTAQATSASKAKSEFLSRMSHELRTPLNAVLGMNELLIRDNKEPLSEKQMGRAYKINEAGKHLLSIVDDVLDLSRIEAGSMDVSLDITDCQVSINESIKLVENKAIERDVTIINELPSQEIYAIADAKRLKQVIVNLLDNAIKYNKRGGQVTIILDTDIKDTVRISVVDTGYGIPKESRDKLFLPFSRVNTEHLDVDGTGIGLSLCKHLIDLMNGKIGMENPEGNGCCFWVQIPRASHDASIIPDEKTSLPEIPASSRKSNNKILLVEDNEVNREVAIDMLEALGYEADIAVDGKQAVDILATKKYALVLMDCEMPVMDGFTATEKIRKSETLLERDQDALTIIALTAHAISGTKDRCLRSGMNDFLSKPFSMATLQQKLDQWVPDNEKDKSI